MPTQELLRSKVTIRCHPCTPVAPEEIQDWLELKVNQLRTSEADAIVRLSRLTQQLPSTEIEMGWLIELDLPEESNFLDRTGPVDRLAEVLTDMRFLGLHPTLLIPHPQPG